MTHCLEGFVPARQTMAEIERRASDCVPERLDAGVLKGRLGHVSVMLHQTAALRPGRQTPTVGRLEIAA